MNHRLLYITALASLLFAACKHEDPNPPEPPAQYDTVVSYVDTIRIDTIAVDTLWHDTAYYEQNDRRIVGYVAYYGTKLPDPHLVTHVCYSFAELYLSADSVYQRFGLKGTDLRWRQTLALKDENPDLKILLSFSHTVSNSDNAQRGGFSVMSADSAMRHQFALDCLAFCEQWGLDGIDIDWEFPGISWSGHHCDPRNDSKNYTLLMKELREVLGNDYLLTYAANVRQTLTTEEGTLYINNKAVEPYVDFINVMTYDMCSAPQPHNAYLCSGYWDISRMYNSYKAAKYPMEKITLGIPFYGRHEYDDGEYYYHTLETLMTQYPSIWTKLHNEGWMAAVAYKNGEMWCSYDDAWSIAKKSEWAKSVGIGGLMWWEASGDDIHHTLGKACYDGMKLRQDSVPELLFTTDTIAVTDTIVTITKREIK